MSTFARRMREARANAGLNQQDFADAVGVSQGTVSKWERGQQEPDLSTILKIAEVAKVNPMHLAFHAEEHSLAHFGSTKSIPLKGAISQNLTEQTFWDEQDWIGLELPLPAEWKGLTLFAMLVKDDSANILFASQSIVIIAQLIQEGVDLKNGDVVFYSMADLETDMRKNILAIWNKQTGGFPLLSRTSDARDYPIRLNYRTNIDLFADGGYEAVGLHGMVVGSFSLYQPGRFETVEEASSRDIPF